MRTKRLFQAISFLMAGWLAGAETLIAQDYVVMGTPLVNLRTGPSTGAMVIGRAEKGDLFEVIGEDGE